MAMAILALAGVYFIAGKFGLSLAIEHPSASTIWPPSGIALAALLLCGDRVWPGVFLGAFLVNITTESDLATALGIASGSTLGGLYGGGTVVEQIGSCVICDRLFPIESLGDVDDLLLRRRVRMCQGCFDLRQSAGVAA